MMNGNGSMTFGDMEPYLIGVGAVVLAIVVFVLVRLFRRSSLTARRSGLSPQLRRREFVPSRY